MLFFKVTEMHFNKGCKKVEKFDFFEWKNLKIVIGRI